MNRLGLYHLRHVLVAKMRWHSNITATNLMARWRRYASEGRYG